MFGKAWERSVMGDPSIQFDMKSVFFQLLVDKARKVTRSRTSWVLRDKSTGRAIGMAKWHKETSQFIFYPVAGVPIAASFACWLGSELRRRSRPVDKSGNWYADAFGTEYQAPEATGKEAEKLAKPENQTEEQKEAGPAADRGKPEAGSASRKSGGSKKPAQR